MNDTFLQCLERDLVPNTSISCKFCFQKKLELIFAFHQLFHILYTFFYIFIEYFITYET